MTTESLPKSKSPHNKGDYGHLPFDLCPYCGSREIAGSAQDVDFNGERVTLPVDCEQCGASWNEVYEFDQLENKRGEKIKAWKIKNKNKKEKQKQKENKKEKPKATTTTTDKAVAQTKKQ